MRKSSGRPGTPGSGYQGGHSGGIRQPGEPGIISQGRKITALIGGVLMLLIGLLLIFKPGWLMFG